MLARTLAHAAVAGTISLAAAGCQNKVFEENKQLHNQNRELQRQLTAKDAELAGRPDASAIQSMQQEIASRDAKIAELEGQLRQPVQGAPPAEAEGLEGISVTKDEAAGTMTVNIPGDVLFASGQSTLRDAARNTLTKVAGAIKRDYAGKHLFVEGHTDSDPISKTKNQWQDNLDLSAARARAVADYLGQQGISSSLIGTRAFGDTSPKGGKAASRRVEIVVKTR